MLDPYLWRRRFVLVIYNCIFPFVLLILIPGSLWKMRRRGGYGRNFWQRFGIFDGELKTRLKASKRPYWLHAVSVGEVGVARKLIKEIVRLDPDRPLVLSTTTSTGHAVASKDAPSQLSVIYSPVDFPWIASRVLRWIHPERLIFIEAEVWPNLASLARRRGVKLILANARLSPRSGSRFRKVRWFVKPIFTLLDRVLVQFPEGVERWKNIGARPEAIVLTGSVKYDEPVAKPGRAEEFRGIVNGLWGEQLPQMILGASTFAAEEMMLANALRTLRGEFPNLKLILVPRHVERCPELKLQLEASGLVVALRSNPSVPNPDMLLVDTTGELRDWQQLPQAVVIGKSFCAKGGQNPVEAIAAGTPVVTGPHMNNFDSVMRLLLEARGVQQISGEEMLVPVLAEILRNPSASHAASLRGRQALEPHRGATRRCAEIICNESL